MYSFCFFVIVQKLYIGVVYIPVPLSLLLEESLRRSRWVADS